MSLVVVSGGFWDQRVSRQIGEGGRLVIYIYIYVLWRVYTISFCTCHRYKHSFFEHAMFVTIAATSSAFTTTRQIKENQQKHTLKRGFWESEVFKAKPYLIIEGPFVTYIVFTFMYGM